MTKIDWENITNYIESVGSTDTNFPFKKPQSSVKVTASGATANIIYTIGGQSGTLTPGQSVTVTGSISSMTLRSASGQQPFQVWAVEAGTEKEEDTSNDISVQLAQKANDLTALFLKKLQNGEITKIKLIGDSITEGVGATGHTVPTSNPIIFDDGAGNVFHEGDYTSGSWANFFRNYLTANYPSVSFVNAGIGGKSAKWANANKQYWVSSSEDVTFVMLGTNDRWDGVDQASFKTDLVSFLSYVKQRSNLMIVMTATPTLNDYSDPAGTTLNTAAYHFSMREVDKIVSEVCIENNYPHISMYRKLLNFARTGKAPLENLLETNGGSHPVDSGHLVIWRELQQSLGIIDNPISWGKSQFSMVAGVSFDYSTLATDSKFVNNYRVKYLWQIGQSDTNLAQYPESSAGTLIITFGDNTAYIWEEYNLRGSGRVYRRYWNVNTWTAWIPLFSTQDFSVSFDYSTAANDARFINYKYYYYRSIGASDPNIAQYPESSAGVLAMRRGESTADIWEEYSLRSSGKVYRRYWNAGNSTWTAWFPLFVPPILGTQRLTTDPITSYTVGTDEYAEIGLSNPTIANYPAASAGTLKTHRGVTDIYSYQEYRIRQSVSVYARYWDSTNSVWTAWTKISAV